MKKFAIACVAVFALALTSCGEVEKCYKITVSYAGYSASSYVWGTGNDVSAAVAETEAAYEAAGVDGVEISYAPTSKSAGDCY
jgi:hypothetical protein